MREQKSKKIILNFALPAPQLKRSFILLGSFCVLIFAFFTFSKAEAATIYFSPSSGNFSVGNILTMSVLVNTEGKAINNTDAVINFPTALLDIVSVNKSGSIFSLWVEEPAFSNNAGTITFNGGLPTPGFNGTTGKILNIVFRVKSAGPASIVFSSAAVRANDGYGTDILKTREQAQFNLISEVRPTVPIKEEIPPTPIAGQTPKAPAILSTTHPDPNKWYAVSDAEFTWDLPSGATAVRLLVGKIPQAIPIVYYEPAISSKDLDNLEDGIWYFHIRLKNASGWGETTHFRFQIDTEPPEPFDIKFLDGKETDNPRPTILFNTADSLSGVDHYKIKIGDGDFFDVSSEVVSSEVVSSEVIVASNPYTLPPQSSGKRIIIVQAFDKAGNSSSASEKFVIKPINAPTITEYTPEITAGETGFIKGNTYFEAKVVAWFEKQSKFAFEKPFSRETKSDKDGNFLLIINKDFEKGDYKVWLEAIDKKGAFSLPSEKLDIFIAEPVLFRMGVTLLNFLVVAIPLIALFFLLSFMIWYGQHKFTRFRKKLRKEVSEAERSLHNAFDLIREDIREQIKLLEKAKTKRQLTEEEEKIIKRLKKDLDDAEKSVRKEIEDIEKEVK